MIQNISKKIVLLGTGGTIAGVATDVGDNLGYVAGTVGVEQLLRGVPGLSAVSHLMVTEQVAQLDSKDMTFQLPA